MSVSAPLTISPQSLSVWKRFDLSYNIDPEKYNRKGYGKYVGYLFLTLYVTLFPAILKQFWPLLQENLDGRNIVALGIVTVNSGVLITYNTFMYFIYTGKYPFFEKYRVSQKAWPWEQNPQKWRQTIKKTLLVVARNALLIGIPVTFIQAYTTHYQTALSAWPTTNEVVWQSLLFIVVEDFFFYLTHSLFHRPQFYWIHKQHHEYSNTVTIAAEYCHPIEYVVANGFPTFIGFKLLSYIYPVHAVTIFTYFLFRIIETCDGHSGYEWSWSQSTLLPFSAGSTYHNFHHSHNVGNYGSFFKFWDTIFGTNHEYIRYMKKTQKAKEAQE